MQAEHGATQVDAQHAVSFGHVVMADRSVQIVDAGVVEGAIERAEVRYSLVDHNLHVIIPRNVSPDRD